MSDASITARCRFAMLLKINLLMHCFTEVIPAPLGPDALCTTNFARRSKSTPRRR